MAHRSGCRELHAIGHVCAHLGRAFKRIVRAYTCKNATTRHTRCLNCTFSHKIDNTADTRTTILSRSPVLVDFNFFNIVEVNGTQVSSTTTGIVEWHAINANQDIPCRNASNAHRLKTAHAPLRIPLDSRKRRQNFGGGHATTFPSRRKNFSIVCARNGNAGHRRRCYLGRTKILYWSGLIDSHVLRRDHGLCKGGTPRTTQKHRNYSGFVE